MSLKKLRLLFTLTLSAFCVTGCDLSEYLNFLNPTQQNEEEDTSGGNSGDHSGSGDTDAGSGGTDDDTGEGGSGDDSGGGSGGSGDGSGGGTGGDDSGGGPIKGGYYDGIDPDSSTLLSDLRTLNLTKRRCENAYKTLNTLFRYTDYDPSSVQYDENNQPYSTKLLSFYSGKVTTSFNKEHVWPNSRGGGQEKGLSGAPYVENDIYMPRPTISEENSDRGNSCYVEGMCHDKNGWDPVTAFESSLGVYTSIRGECARIIFYCMTVNAKLRLVDDANLDFDGVGGRVTMGKLSDMLRWNLENPVNDREIRRQSGGEYLQGNRNAFVDHPEFACKIWGTYNQATRQICGRD